MPLYEYRCHGCGKVFEVLQKFSDEPLKVHEECGGEVERLISPPAFQFKGSGWYVTDYGGNGKSKAPSNATPEMKEAMKKGGVEAPKTTEGKTTESKPSTTTSSPEK
jgi:putative FmdB family regulatory protein